MADHRPTGYSNFTRGGRGMPTFKQYAFFASRRRVGARAFVGKIDDDTAPCCGCWCLCCASCAARLASGPPSSARSIGRPSCRARFPRRARRPLRLGWSLHACSPTLGAYARRERLPRGVRRPRRGAAVPVRHRRRLHLQRAAAAAWGARRRWRAGSPTRAAPTTRSCRSTRTRRRDTGSPTRRSSRSGVDVGPFIHDAHCHAEGARKRLAEHAACPPTSAARPQLEDGERLRRRGATRAPPPPRRTTQGLPADHPRPLARARRRRRRSRRRKARRRPPARRRPRRRSARADSPRRRAAATRSGCGASGTSTSGRAAVARLNTVGRKGELVSRLLSSVQS